jgi:hypothetical protein
MVFLPSNGNKNKVVMDHEFSTVKLVFVLKTVPKMSKAIFQFVILRT